MLATYHDVNSRTGTPPSVNGTLDQRTNTASIERVERVRSEDPHSQILKQEVLLRVVPADSEGHLSQVICAEREELGGLGQLGSCDRCAWGFDHGAEFVLNVDSMELAQLGGFTPEPLCIILPVQDFGQFSQVSLFRIEVRVQIHLLLVQGPGCRTVLNHDGVIKTNGIVHPAFPGRGDAGPVRGTVLAQPIPIVIPVRVPPFMVGHQLWIHLRHKAGIRRFSENPLDRPG